tara:strand:- start:118 stop:384 length:267 start_codon:yes stop_codon:yes gene_type:complete
MEPTKTTRSFRINDDIWELLKKEARRRKTTASALVTQAITEHISGVMKKDGGIDFTDLLKVLGGLQAQSEKLAIKIKDAKDSFTEEQS